MGWTVLADVRSFDGLAANAVRPGKRIGPRPIEREPAIDPDICWQAIYSRDPRFDGRFFMGATTTGVYCRNICPVPFAKPKNTLLFACTAAAESAGFRPCRRCQPQAAPGTPAWLGTSAVVNRAFRLILEGALNEGSVEDLAERMGLGTRQLRRLMANASQSVRATQGGAWQLLNAVSTGITSSWSMAPSTGAPPKRRSSPGPTPSRHC
jgi:methylphosphotriester-DNA--protein-cysteine methyltransferase